VSKMAEKPKFTLDETVEVEPQAPLFEQPQPELRPNKNADNSSYSRNDFSASEVDQAGLRLARDIEHGEYYPVILIGSAASGKTSLLLSLLATIKIEPELKSGISMGDPILDRETDYGRYVYENSVQFFGQKTQDFIEGRAAPKTSLQYPFFVPIVLRPENAPEQKFAFMESNGEWYRPDRNTSELFPPLRRQIEDFIANYAGGITFIHLVPYTQQAVRSSGADRQVDAAEMLDASLAIAGALQAYEAVRLEKQKDRHLMLVTKWDAHSPPGLSKLDVLSDASEDVDVFVREHYPQALTALQALGLREAQVYLNSYCSGIMNDAGILMLKQENELRPAVMKFPINLWTWLYRGAREDRQQPSSSPFPSPPHESELKLFLKRLLDRFF
jgi:hypothetical protein